MPTYDYLCERCEHRFEQFQSITASSLRTCPACGKRALKRLIGAGAGLIFKGSGFYQTDYRSEGYKKAAEADKPKSESTSGESTAKDTKAAPKGKDAPAGTASAEKTVSKSKPTTSKKAHK